MAPPAVGGDTNTNSKQFIKPPSNTNPVYSSSRNLSVQNGSAEKLSKQASSKASLKTPSQKT
jgi:hypothetical protein